MRLLAIASLLFATPSVAHDALVGSWAITGTTDYECAAIYYADDGKIALTYDGSAKKATMLFTANNNVGANVRNLSLGMIRDKTMLKVYKGLKFYAIEFNEVRDYDMEGSLPDKAISDIGKANHLVILSGNIIVAKYTVGETAAAMDALRSCATTHRYGQ